MRMWGVVITRLFRPQEIEVSVLARGASSQVRARKKLVLMPGVGK